MSHKSLAHSAGPVAPTSTMKQELKHDLMAYRIGSFAMRLVPASSDRDWMNQSDQRFANRCLPMLMANQAGWLILNDRRLRAKWLGNARIDNVVVETAGKPPYAALSHFGHGILTFTLPFLFRTPPGMGLLFRGPANAPKDAIAPLEGLTETDWAIATATMNWKFTRADTWIEFAEGEPICMVVPQQFEVLEAMQPGTMDIKQDPDTQSAYYGWKRSRDDFLRNLRILDPGTVQQGWQGHYFQGTVPSTEPNPPAPVRRHRTRLRLREFVVLGAADDAPPERKRNAS